MITPLRNLLIETIYECNRELLVLFCRDHDRIKVLMPNWLYQIYKQEFYQNSIMNSIDETIMLDGITVEIGYENCIVIFHEKYSLYFDDSLILKKPLVPGKTIENDLFIKKIYSISGIEFKSNPQDN